MLMKLTDAILSAILARMIAAGGPFDPAALFVGVATAVDDQGVNTVMGDITEATGDMLTRSAITTWGTPYKLADGRWVVDAVQHAVFSPADETEGQTLTHYFLATAGAAGTLKAFEQFGTPKVMVDENSQLTIIVRLTVDLDGRWSQSVIYDGSP